MTTIVTISAHCGDTKEVRVTITGSKPEEFTLADGEKVERFAYDDRVITVQEVAKIDRRALEVDAAEFAVAQARLRLHDAASRGFHMNNRALLEADVAAKQAELDALRQPAVVAVDLEVRTSLEAMFVGDLMQSAPPGVVSDPGRQVPWHRSGGGQRVAPLNAQDQAVYASIAANYETNTYSDGTTATGPGPLPEQSPAQQEAEITGQGDAALTPEAVKYLGSLDPAPFAEPTGDADPSLAPTEPYPEPT